MKIAVLGGTGPEGLGIAARLAAAGETVIIGSRSAERAVEAAKSLRARVPKGDLSGAANPEAAAGAEIVFFVVPYEGVDHILETCGPVLAGKVELKKEIPDSLPPLSRRKTPQCLARKRQGSLLIHQGPRGGSDRHSQKRAHMRAGSKLRPWCESPPGIPENRADISQLHPWKTRP